MGKVEKGYKGLFLLFWLWPDRCIFDSYCALQKDHLRRFNVTWELHNKHLYHSIVYTEPAIQGCLDTLCEQLRWVHLEFIFYCVLESAQSYVYEPQGRHFTTLWCYSSGTPDERQPDERSPLFFFKTSFSETKKKYFPVNESMTKLHYSFKTSFCFIF